MAAEREQLRRLREVPGPSDLRAVGSGLVEQADPQPGERLLDLACGTGVVARVAAPRVLPAGTVTGADVNAGMLATARRAAGGDAAIDWHEADALDLPFRDGSFDSSSANRVSSS